MHRGLAHRMAELLGPTAGMTLLDVTGGTDLVSRYVAPLAGNRVLDL
ncbi:MAG: hypothetical protein ACRDRO_10745 [Pseudonocardiaceae bacterium]